MLILLLFTAIGLTLFAGAVLALLWAVRSGQLDDLETPALRMLHDDPPPGLGVNAVLCPDAAQQPVPIPLPFAPLSLGLASTRLPHSAQERS